MTINGIELTEGQKMALNCALCSFLAEMQEEHALGKDEIGEDIRKGYVKRLFELLHITQGG